MAIFTEETSLYEILIRVQQDGSWAAHYQTLTEVKKDGTAISTMVDPVQPLNVEDAQALSILNELVGDTTANNVVLVVQLKETISNQLAMIEDLAHRLESLQSVKVEVSE